MIRQPFRGSGFRGSWVKGQFELIIRDPEPAMPVPRHGGWETAGGIERIKDIPAR